MAESKPDERAKSRARFQEMIQRLDVLCKQRPNEYIARVVGLVVLGYAYIGFALAVLVGLSGLMLVLLIKLPFLAIKLAIPVLILIWLIVRSFWIKPQQAPEGIYLNRRDHPKVFEIVEEIQQSISAPKVDAIVVISDFNAGVCQIPRLGLLGWHKNYLLLGMPLMQAFSLSQLKAVLGHEMGHLASSHGVRSAWIYQVRGVWSQLMENLASDQSFASILFGKFFQWYAPFFDAYSFALARVQEYHADQCAVDLVGKEASAAMLVGTHIKGQYIETKYWSQLWEGTKDSKVPYDVPFSHIAEKMHNAITLQQAQSWLEQALKRKTDYLNTHPSLTERVKEVLQISEEDAAAWARSNLENILEIEESASKTLFGSQLGDVLSKLNRQWCEIMAEPWKEQFERYEECRKELRKLEDKSAQGEISDDDAVSIACITATLESFEAAASLFAEAFQKNPRSAQLHYHYGQCLIEQENADGVKYLEEAMQLDRSLALECCNTIYTFLKLQGDDAGAEIYIDKANESIKEWIAARQERATVYPADTYLPHDVDDAAVLQLVSALRKHERIVKAHLVRKEVKVFPDQHCLVLVLDFRFTPFGQADADQRTIADIASSMQFPQETLLIARAHAPRSLLDAIKSIPSSCIIDS